MIGLPDVNTIFDTQDLPNYFPDKTHLQSQSNSPSQSSQLSSLFNHNENLVMPSLSSISSSTNLPSQLQFAYKDCISSRFPPYEYMHYESPLTTTQQPIMSHQQDYFAIPTLSMSK